MPPKFKFTREEIITVAVNLTREKGIKTLTARSLAERLGSSSKPIFGLFQSMEELQNEVLLSADRLYHSYLQSETELKKYPPYKASGMAYIKFAKEEKEFFKLLFMRDRTNEKITEDRESVRPQLDIITETFKITEDEAYLFHMEMWIFVHGIATMAATSYLDWDEDFIGGTLTDVYRGLSCKFNGGN